MARARRDLLRLLRHVLAASRRSRSRDGRLGCAAGSRAPTGWADDRRARSRWSWSRSAATPSTAPARACCSEPISDTFDRSRRHRARADRRRCGSRTRSISWSRSAVVAGIFWAGIAGMRTVARAGDRSTASSAAAVRAQLHPDRARLPRRPLLQPRSSSRSRPSSPTCSPTRSATAPTSSAPPRSGIDYRLDRARRVWYVQVAALVIGHVVALVLGHDRALAIYGDPRRRPLAVLDARDDGRLHHASASSCSPTRTSDLRWRTSATGGGTSSTRSR